MRILFLALLLLSSPLTWSLEAMTDDELSSSTGEGIGAVVDNLSIFSEDYGHEDDFVITLNLNDDQTPDKFILSELRLHKTGTVAGAEDSGGSFGTVSNPVFLGDLRRVDVFSGDRSNSKDLDVTSTTVMRSEFPGAGIDQVDRTTSFQKQYPNQYKAANDNFLYQLDQVSDPFTLHWRFDDAIATGPNSGAWSESFRAFVDLEGFRFYGTYSDIFATEKGVSVAGATGLYIDRAVLNGDEGNNAATQLILNGIDIYNVLGTADQPLTISSVEDTSGNTQLQLEIGALPASVGVAPKSNIFIKSIYFGEKYNEDLRTGIKPGANLSNLQPDDYYYAFQPVDDVGNVIEIVGLSVQHLRITTLDL